MKDETTSLFTGESDNQKTAFFKHPQKELILYILLVLLILIKVLWGYWERDLTFGDTSYYFQTAVRWHLDGQVNIVWSPLYTAYYGAWLGITENAYIATFLHRVGLILVSTGLVAWLGLLTLPRLLALLLVIWWIALPIHYDTLYEVHLFGALPILVMAVVSVLANERWKGPLLLGIAIISTLLIRNEYILVVVVLTTLRVFNLLWMKRPVYFLSSIRTIGIRYGVMLLVVSLLVSYFYSVSFIQGRAIREASNSKHTVNMCQVYAFGYQQRHSDWTGSPWTECSDLMQKKFFMPKPSLREMIAANPMAVAEHFLWNLSLIRAGLEVLLFNVTSARDNPDYAPILIVPVVPTLLVVLTLIICLGGTVVIFRKSSTQYMEMRERLMLMMPLLLAVTVMAVAIIITQRPRPSYLLGGGVLYMWMVSIMFCALFPKLMKIMDSKWVSIFFATGFIILMPTYHSLPLPSKMGSLGIIYNQLRSQAPRLCQGSGLTAIGEYASEIYNYVCSPYVFNKFAGRDKIITLSSLPREMLSTPEKFVNHLAAIDAGALVIDPILARKYPELQSCPELRDVLLKHGWIQLVYTVINDKDCIAVFAK